MNIDVWIPVIAAILSALVTALVTKLDVIMDLLQRDTRKISGEWEGYSYLNPSKTNNSWDYKGVSPNMTYLLTISQKGKIVTGEWRIKDAPDTVSVRNQKLRGKIVNDYLVYEIRSSSPEQFRFSTTLLKIYTSGREMDGFWVANGASDGSHSVCTGYTRMVKR